MGARIEGINGKPLSDVVTFLMDYHGGSQEFFRHYGAAALMLSPALLHAVGLSDSRDRLTGIDMTATDRSRVGETFEFARTMFKLV